MKNSEILRLAKSKIADPKNWGIYNMAKNAEGYTRIGHKSRGLSILRCWFGSLCGLRTLPGQRQRCFRYAG